MCLRLSHREVSTLPESDVSSSQIDFKIQKLGYLWPRMTYLVIAHPLPLSCCNRFKGQMQAVTQARYPACQKLISTSLLTARGNLCLKLTRLQPCSLYPQLCVSAFKMPLPFIFHSVQLTRKRLKCMLKPVKTYFCYCTVSIINL